jgi:hypothetical protein
MEVKKERTKNIFTQIRKIKKKNKEEEENK